ncbi:MAG TPA: hypothetical protein PKK69_04625, partial [Ferruginibacter sp.]|nr:hypothetical protein [Ferruginibacter sp.]
VVHNKGWQLLAVPTTGQTVKQAWQENAANVSANPSPGYGIQITSDLAGATALGFDIATPTGSGPGMKTYNSTTNNYTGIANTNALALYNKKGYLVFVRGDRTVTTSAQAATTTILRSTGKIFSPGTDAPASTTVAAGKFESVGNPYPSAIDFTSVLSGSSGIDAKFYVWDPSYPGTQGYGGFQSMSSADGYLPHPGGSTYYPTGTPVTKIQSGQAFLVYSTAGGTLNFTEANKTSGSSLVARQQQIKTTLNGWLYKNNGQLVDGNAIVFDAAYSNALDPQDADKFTNGGEALGILVNDRRLAIEARNLPVITDTIQFYTSGLRQQSYVLAIATQNWAATGTVAFLVDRFTGMRTALVSADVTNYEFAVTSDPASQQSNRFIIVFQSLRPVPVSYVELTGSRTRNAGIQLNWKAANETDMQQYQLQRKTIRGDWQTIDHQTALNNQQAITNYAYLDAAAGNETLQYRVLAQGLDQRIQYSNVISFGKLIVQPAIQILQNPVQQSVVRIRYEDLATGKYQVQLVDESGKLVWKQAIVISQPVGNLALPLTTALASGFYHISVTGDQTNWQSNLILE